LDLVVGPNGAGKSTFVRLTLASAVRDGVVVVNADEIARDRWPEDPEGHSYDAARIAARRRADLIKGGESFITETVFSHPSKLDLIDDAHRAGYVVTLHVLLIPQHLALPRVRLRVESGGHDVPARKVVERYERLWPLVATALTRADSATVYDNVALAGPRPVARFAQGVPVGEVRWPPWTPDALCKLT
jgi:predicted ABC-type ATPase